MRNVILAEEEEREALEEYLLAREKEEGENEARNTTGRDQTRVSRAVSKLCLFSGREKRIDAHALFEIGETFPIIRY